MRRRQVAHLRFGFTNQSIGIEFLHDVDGNALQDMLVQKKTHRRQ
jgi:hypothetical protein